MRTFMTCLALCVLPLALAGCDEESSNADLGSDLNASGNTCLQVLSCASACAGMAACQQACVASGSSAAQAKFQGLFTCGFGACLVPQDGGAPACTSAMDTSAGCQSCVMSAVQGPACTTQLNACLSG